MALTRVKNKQLFGSIATSKLASGGGFLTSSSAISNTQLPAGSIINVYQDYNARNESTVEISTSFTMEFETTVTPIASSSKFLIMLNLTVDNIGDSTFDGQLRRNVSSSETVIGDTGNAFNGNGNWGSSNFHGQGYTMTFLDTPNTSSQINYRFYIRENSGGRIRLMSTGPCGLTVMEIKG
jgi:hypothetical protein